MRVAEMNRDCGVNEWMLCVGMKVRWEFFRMEESGNQSRPKTQTYGLKTQFACAPTWSVGPK